MSSSPRKGKSEGADKPRLQTCVACGARELVRKRVTVRLNDGQTVTGVMADVCPRCGERYYDREAMRRLELARTERRDRAA